MLRRIYNGWRFVSAILALALLFVTLHTSIPAAILIQVLNGVFFGAFVSIVLAYGPLLLETFFGDGSYNRAFHYSFSVTLQWCVMLTGRGTSVWYRVIDVSNAVNDNVVVAGLAYLSIVAIVWQTMVITENAIHDRKILIGSALAGGVVAIALIIAQSWGGDWPLRLP